MSLVRSMTGFAAVESSLGEGPTATLTIKGVNHRFLDVHLRLPSGCDALEAEMRRAVKASLTRGHVEVALEVGRAEATSAVRLQGELFGALVEELRVLMARHGLTQEIDVAGLLRVPGMVVHEAKAPAVSAAVLGVEVPRMLEAAMAQFQRTREMEGAALAAEIRESVRRLETLLDQVHALRGDVRERQFERLTTRLRELLVETTVSDERLLGEAALLAEKSDVEEEAVRLRTHLQRVDAILEEGGAVGKQLDFLLQECNREANTILSKSGTAAGPASTQLIALGLEMKAEIERVREQVQNLE